jgi:TusA-related sulfurtransferase
MSSPGSVSLTEKAGNVMIRFDLREKLIPFSLLQISNNFREMQPGDEMEILAGDCPIQDAIFKDVMRILPKSDYELLSQNDFSGDTPVKRLRLKKKKPKANI